MWNIPHRTFRNSVQYKKTCLKKWPLYCLSILWTCGLNQFHEDTSNKWVVRRCHDIISCNFYVDTDIHSPASGYFTTSTTFYQTEPEALISIYKKTEGPGWSDGTFSLFLTQQPHREENTLLLTKKSNSCIQHHCPLDVLVAAFNGVGFFVTRTGAVQKDTGVHTLRCHKGGGRGCLKTATWIQDTHHSHVVYVV